MKNKAFENLSLQDIKGEIWKDIKDFEGYYQISNFGRVKRLEREILKQGRYIKLPLMIRKSYRNYRGKNQTTTLILIISFDKVNYRYRTKKLVIDAFGNKKCKSKKKWIFHKDMDYTNNHINNLYYGNEDDISNIVNKRKREKGKLSKYKGVSKQSNGIYQMSINIKGKVIRKAFKKEIDAMKKYDFYIKKYNLKREGNFINKN